jgi:hypothetical protein
MTTIPEVNGTVKFDHSLITDTRQVWRQAVSDVAAKAKATLPEPHARIDKAVALVLAGDLAGVPRGGALGIIEIGRDRNNRISDFLSQVFGDVVHQLAEYHGGNLFGRAQFADDVKAYGIIRARDDFVGHVFDLVLDFLVAATPVAAPQSNGSGARFREGK